MKFNPSMPIPSSLILFSVLVLTGQMTNQFVIIIVFVTFTILVGFHGYPSMLLLTC